MHVSEVWTGGSLSARATRAALTPLSWLYGAGWQAYLGAYRLGLKRQAEPHCPVVCVGNLMVGGTGKSPLVIYLAELIPQLGHRVVISASGYGSPHAEAATLAPDGPLRAAEWGDEPAMLRWLLPDVPIIVGRRRVLAGEICHEVFPDGVLLMDDGFQHLPLRKHIQILLDPADPPNSHCLPAGPYREPRGNRRRADAVIPGQFKVAARPLTFSTTEGQTASLPDLFSVLCALGQPQRFLDSLPRTPVATAILPDHDPLSAGTLFDRLPRDVPVVVTTKDWVKLRERPTDNEREVLIARHSVSVEPMDSFGQWLSSKLHEFEST